jgi:hypothetical protein
MINRCTRRAKEKDRKDYFERGISVCQEWLNDPTNFVEWSRENGYKKGLEIDRIDNNGNYGPSNCRFVTRLVNIHNRRPLSNNKSGYTGVFHNLYSDKFIATVYSSAIKRSSTVLGRFSTAWEACQARNKFIIENNLPHKIQEERV